MTRKWAALTFMILYALPIYTVDATQPEQTESRVEIRPTRVERAPVIDGILDDSAWQQVSVSEPFITYNPTRGEVLPQRTEVWTAYDAENLYFAFRCYDNEPDQIKTSVTQRDGMFSDDWVGLSLDALGTRQTSYDLFVNPNGIQGDILTSAVSGEDGAPDFVWDSAGRITDQGYEVEMRIPLRSIRFNSGNETIMGILFWRRISRLGTSGSWVRQFIPGESWIRAGDPSSQEVSVVLLSGYWQQAMNGPGMHGRTKPIPTRAEQPVS